MEFIFFEWIPSLLCLKATNKLRCLAYPRTPSGLSLFALHLNPFSLKRGCLNATAPSRILKIKPNANAELDLWWQDWKKRLVTVLLCPYSIICKRQREGIETAKSKGKYLVRPKAKNPDNWNKVYPNWKNCKVLAREALKLVGVSKNVFMRGLLKFQHNVNWNDFCFVIYYIQIAKDVNKENTLTQALADMLIDKVLVYPDKRIDVMWKIQDFCRDWYDRNELKFLVIAWHKGALIHHALLPLFYSPLAGAKPPI